MPTETSVVSSDAVRRAELIFAAAALILACLIQSVAVWPQLGREAAGNREIISALSIRALVTDGLQLDYPTPLLGHPWRVPDEFGLYCNLAAVYARVADCPAETAGRTVALGFFYLGLPALYLLARQSGVNRAGAVLALAFWLLSPFGRSQACSLGGTTAALTCATWWLYCLLKYLEAPRLTTGPAAIFLGMAAAVTNPFCFLPFFLAGLIFWWHTGARARPRAALVAFLPSVVASALWIRHTDLLKAANPYAGFLRAGPVWSAAFGPPAQRLELDFWIAFLRLFFGALVAPVSGLLLLAFASGRRLQDKFPLAGLVAVLVAALVLLLPLYEAQAVEVGPLCLISALVLAGIFGSLFRFAGSRPAVALVAGALLFLAQAQLTVAVSGDSTVQLPNVGELAQAVSRVTSATDLVIAAGQDWDPHFAYRAQRRMILVPAGRETDAAALTRAVGPSREWQVGAVVLTGRYRSETAYVAELRGRFALAEKPLLQTSSTDVYVPAEAEPAMRARMAGSAQAALLRVDARPPPVVAVVPTKPSPVALKADEDPFVMMSPRQNRYAVPYGLSAYRLNGETCFFAHAPTALEFDLPAGGSHLEMSFFMAEGSYTGKGNTDGADVVAIVRHPGGKAEEIFRQHLDPVNNPADRAPQKIAVDFHAESDAILVVHSLPGPDDRANYDWIYFSRIAIK